MMRALKTAEFPFLLRSLATLAICSTVSIAAEEAAEVPGELRFYIGTSPVERARASTCHNST